MGGAPAAAPAPAAGGGLLDLMGGGMAPAPAAPAAAGGGLLDLMGGAPAAAAPAAPAGGGLLDLMGGGMAPAQAPPPAAAGGGLLDLMGGAPAAAAPVPAGGGLLDLMGGAPAAVAAPAGMGMGVSAVALKTPQITAAFNNLVSKTEGWFYEDDHIQIGIKSEYQGKQGRVAAYIGNKSGGAITGFSSSVSAGAGIRASAAQVNDVLPPSSQSVQQIQVEFLAPFTDPPKLMLSFTSKGAPVSICLNLPVVITKFCEPLSFQAPAFFAEWKNVFCTCLYACLYTCLHTCLYHAYTFCASVHMSLYAHTSTAW